MFVVCSILNFLLLCGFEVIENMYNFHILEWDLKANSIISVISAFAASFVVNFIDLWFWFGKKIGAI